MNYLLGLLVFVAAAQDACSKKHTSKNYGGKIVGGTNATSIDMYPYQVYLLLQRGLDYYQCGGSILSDRAILTAAHCLTGIQTAYIRIGSVESNSGGSEYQSSNFRIHPLYNIRPNNYDVGVIRLLEPMDLDGQTAKAVALPARNAPIPAGTDLTVTGWGATSENGPISSTLMTVGVTAITNQECSQNVSGITDKMVCASGDGKDSCQGDSGGPAVEKSSGVLLGVTSFGIGCARPGYPGVYARVPALRAWIRTNAGV